MHAWFSICQLHDSSFGVTGPPPGHCARGLYHFVFRIIVRGLTCGLIIAQRSGELEFRVFRRPGHPVHGTAEYPRIYFESESI